MKQQTFFSGKNRLTLQPSKSEVPPPRPREPLNSYAGLVSSVTLFIVLAAAGSYFGDGEPPTEASAVSVTAVCDRSCENDECTHPWGDDELCAASCRAHLADCSEAELGAIACAGDCESINQCLLNAPCD